MKDLPLIIPLFYLAKIGKNCVLKNCIVDRHSVIPDGMQIGVDIEEDSKRFRVSSTVAGCVSYAKYA